MVRGWSGGWGGECREKIQRGDGQGVEWRVGVGNVGGEDTER